MGLLYPFPVSEEETDRISRSPDQGITLKSYGLPMVFWGYLGAILIVIVTMFLLINGPLQKLLDGTDLINQLLAYAVYFTLIFIPAMLLGFYFYEKFLTKKGNFVTVTHRCFWLPFWKKTYELENANALVVQHFMQSPNLARLQADPELRGFENKGYFQLWAKLKDGRMVELDRHSRQADLKQMAELLSRY